MRLDVGMIQWRSNPAHQRGWSDVEMVAVQTKAGLADK
jgi:hypothetical protein